MKEIIGQLVKDLTQQRRDIVAELRDLDYNHPQFMTREQNLKMLISDIDYQIQNHLNNVNLQNSAQ